MKNFFNNYLGIVFLFITLYGCSSREVKQSEQSVKLFFEALKKSNTEDMSKLYKNINQFDSYYKSDSIKVSKSHKINDTIINVNVENFFTNGFGKLNKKKIDFYVSLDSTKSFSKIIDSKGLTNHSENNLYDFAKKIGCLKDTDTTDFQINLKLNETEIYANKIQTEMLLGFMKNVKVANWSWESGYGGSASGKGIVKNNTTFSIPNVKYIIKYTDRNGNVLTTDDGYISYDKIDYGESKSFTFYTSYIGKASRASILLEFDEEMIKSYVLNIKEYSGNEYENYLNDNILE